jgi:hypothetical protein
MTASLRELMLRGTKCVRLAVDTTPSRHPLRVKVDMLSGPEYWSRPNAQAEFTRDTDEMPRRGGR